MGVSRLLDIVWWVEGIRMEDVRSECWDEDDWNHDSACFFDEMEDTWVLKASPRYSMALKRLLCTTHPRVLSSNDTTLSFSTVAIAIMRSVACSQA